MKNDLGNLFLKNTFNNPIVLSNISKSKLLLFFKKMTLIRKVEQKVANLIKKKSLTVPATYPSVKRQSQWEL